MYWIYWIKNTTIKINFTFFLFLLLKIWLLEHLNLLITHDISIGQLFKNFLYLWFNCGKFLIFVLSENVCILHLLLKYFFIGYTMLGWIIFSYVEDIISLFLVSIFADRTAINIFTFWEILGNY